MPLATGPISYVVVNSGVADNELKALVADRKWRLIGGFLVAGAAGATFVFDSNNVAVSGIMILGNNGVFVIPPGAGFGYLEGTDSQNLALDVTAGALDGSLVLQEIK